VVLFCDKCLKKWYHLPIAARSSAWSGSKVPGFRLPV
jgi:hypothetical protein